MSLSAIPQIELINICLLASISTDLICFNEVSHWFVSHLLEVELIVRVGHIQWVLQSPSDKPGGRLEVRGRGSLGKAT